MGVSRVVGREVNVAPWLMQAVTGSCVCLGSWEMENISMELDLHTAHWPSGPHNTPLHKRDRPSSSAHLTLVHAPPLLHIWWRVPCWLIKSHSRLPLTLTSACCLSPYGWHRTWTCGFAVNSRYLSDLGWVWGCFHLLLRTCCSMYANPPAVAALFKSCETNAADLLQDKTLTVC